VVIPVARNKDGVLKFGSRSSAGRERIEKLFSTVNANSRAKKDHWKRKQPNALHPHRTKIPLEIPPQLLWSRSGLPL
jgi:hypothetical protein